jgi:hypothetical protein
VISILLKAGADVNAKDIWGNRAIDFARTNTYLKGTDAYGLLETASK